MHGGEGPFIEQVQVYIIALLRAEGCVALLIIAITEKLAHVRQAEWGYLVYGISNESLEVVGTKFDINKKVKNNQDIRNWLSTLLDPCVNIEFKDGFYRNGKKIVVLKVEQSINYPTKFKGQAYVGVGENKNPLIKLLRNKKYYGVN